MLWPMSSIDYGSQVLRGRLVRRYKRFFADVILDGATAPITAHTPNTGRMTGMLEVDNPVLLTYDAKPSRKLDHTLQAICVDGCWVGANPLLPNRLVKRAVERGAIADFAGYRTVHTEVKWRDLARFDLWLTDHDGGGPDCVVEVKSVTLRSGDRALFPDAPSARGRRHIETLMDVMRAGHAAAMVYLVQRDDVAAFAPAAEVDPAYADLLAEAYGQGLGIIPLRCRVDERGVHIEERLPLEFVPVGAGG